MGAANGCALDTTEDAAVFQDAKLAQYNAVIFLSATGDVLTHVQQAAFERGQLPTVAEMESALAKRKADEAEREAERAIERERLAKEREERESLRLERLATWRDALASLDERADLSNLERAGLEAVKLLFPIK